MNGYPISLRIERLYGRGNKRTDVCPGTTVLGYDKRFFKATLRATLLASNIRGTAESPYPRSQCKPNQTENGDRGERRKKLINKIIIMETLTERGTDFGVNFQKFREGIEEIISQLR